MKIKDNTIPGQDAVVPEPRAGASLRDCGGRREGGSRDTTTDRHVQHRTIKQNQWNWCHHMVILLCVATMKKKKNPNKDIFGTG